MSQSGVLETVASPSRQSVYPSKVDWWIAALLLSGPLVCVVVTAVSLINGQSEGALTGLFAGAVTLIITAMFTIPCRYTLLPDSLAIRCGVYSARIPLEHIHAIETSRSWLSGPALSLRRIKISTASRFYLISPVDRERFIEELTAAVKRRQKAIE